MFYTIRPLESSDISFLSEALYQALYVLPGSTPLPRKIIEQPELAKYIRDWGKDSDLGYLAVLKNSQVPMGAAWLRLFAADNPGYGYIDETTPELAISVLPQYRGRGVGTQLLVTLCQQASYCYRAIALSISPTNPALRLYRRCEFEVVKQDERSLILKKLL